MTSLAIYLLMHFEELDDIVSEDSPVCPNFKLLLECAEHHKLVISDSERMKLFSLYSLLSPII